MENRKGTALPISRRPAQVFVIFHFLFSMFLISAGCGAPGEPIPPSPPVPATIKDLAAHQAGDGVELTFTLPSSSISGEKLPASLPASRFRLRRPCRPQSKIWLRTRPATAWSLRSRSLRVPSPEKNFRQVSRRADSAFAARAGHNQRSGCAPGRRRRGAYVHAPFEFHLRRKTSGKSRGGNPAGHGQTRRLGRRQIFPSGVYDSRRPGGELPSGWRR